MNIDRVRVALTGFPGGPGVSTFYCLNALTLLAPLRTFYVALGGGMPVDVDIQVAGAGDSIEDSDGSLSGTWTGAEPAVVHGAETGVYSAPTGLCVTWETGSVRDGSRVRGRTFIVPLGLGNFDNTGSISAAVLADRTTAAQNLINAVPGNLGIWHRPRAARAAVGTLPALSAHPGVFVPVTTAVIHDRAVVLRSRRD